MLSKFRFFKGIVGAKVISIGGEIERSRRTPVVHIPVPDIYTSIEEVHQFRAGWRACEFGRNIYDNPYSSREALIYSLHRAWEYGFTECFNNRRVESIIDTDEECYNNGWASAREGYPNHDNPYPISSHQYSMWNCGWNDFINEH